MELNSKIGSSIWWKGALKGALKGLLIGAAIGIASAVLFQAAIIPATIALAQATGWAELAGIANIFSGFLTLQPLSVITTWTNAIVPWSAFSVIPFALFNGGISAITGLLTGGNIAVNAYKQDVDHRMNEARINQIEARELQLEQTMPPRSRTVQDIIVAGPRMTTSFERAEGERSAAAPQTPTMH